MSNRLTFSLASLILIFALAFVATPAMAATGGPTVTLTEYSGPEDPAAAADPTSNAPHEQERGDFRVKLTFSHSVAALVAANVKVREGNADGSFGTSQDITAAPVAVLNSGGKEYVATVTTTSIANTVTRVHVSVPEDAVFGNTDANLLANVGNSMIFGLPPLNAGTVMLAAPEAVANTPGAYTIEATFDSGQTANAQSLNPAFAPDYVDIMPENSATATVGTPDATTTTGKTTVTITVQLVFGASDVKVKIDPGYVAGSNTITLPPPIPEDPVYQNPPTVALEVVGHDADSRSFQISVSTTPAADTEGEDGTDIPGADIKMHLTIKDGSTPAVDVPVMLLEGDSSNERIGANSYRAFLEYGPFDTLPLTVSIDPNDLSTNDEADDVDAVTATVGTAPAVTPTPTDEDPSVAIMVSNHDAATRQFRVQVTITPGMKADGSAGDPITTVFGLSDLEITDAGDTAVTITTIDERFTAGTATSPAGMYVAILQYNPLAVLPLTITTVDGFDTSDDPPTTAMVPPADTTPTPVVTVPGAPTGLTATADQTANTIALSWTAPTDNGGADITGYTITQTGQAAATYTAAADATSHTTPALAAGDYSFTVKATNSAGDSPESAAATATIDVDGTPIVDNTPPTLAANVGTADPTTGAVMVTLVFNEALSGTPTVTHVVTPASLATTYGVSAVTAGTAPNTYMVTVTPTAATVATGNLPAGTVTLTVTAMDAAGNALASPGNTVPVPLGARTYTPPSGNTPPTFVGTAVGDVYFWVGETGHMSPDLPLGKDDLNDTLTYSVDPALPAGLEAKQIDNNRYVIQGTPTTAQAKTSYQWVVTDSVGQTAKSPFTITIVARLVPGKVMGLTAMQVSHTPNAETVDLAWNKLAVRMKTDANNMGNDGGSAVTSYSIMWESEQGNTGTILHQATPLTEAYTFKLPAYLPIGEYKFKVAAANAVGMGAYSEAATVNVANPPSAPYDLEASIDQVSNRVTLSWKAGSDGGDPITGYVAYIWAPNSQVPVRKVTGSTETTYRTDSLTVEGTYVFRVSAINGCGEGLQSDAQPLAVVLSPNRPPVWVDPNASIDDIVATVGVPIAPIALPNATDPEGENIRYSIRPLLPGLRISFAGASQVNPVLVGTPTQARSKTLVALTATDGQKAAELTFYITVNPSGPPPTARIDTTIPLPAMTIPANGFVVLQRNPMDSGIYPQVRTAIVGLANLDHLFRDRGGIALHGPGTANDLVFSEIMWGSDSSLADDSHSQWIELYNTTGGTLQLSNYRLEFYSARIPATAGAIDEINTLNWGSLHGQRGRTRGEDTLGRFSEPVEIISMYLKINYSRVEHSQARGEQMKDFPNGSNHGHWAASTRPSLNIAATWRLATPGTKPRFTIHGATSVPRGVIISEIGNSGTDAHDWFELYNTTDAQVNLKKWQLSRVTDNGGKGKEDAVLKFPDNDAIQIPAKSFLVIAASNPKNDGNDLAAGINITKGAIDQPLRGLGERGNSTVANYAVLGFGLPNDNKKALFILRNGHGNLGKPAGIQDVIGTVSVKLQGPVVSGWTGYDANNEVYYNTSLWPLHATGGAHGNVIDGTGDEDFRAGRVIQRNNFGGGTGEKHLAVRGYTGVGYDRHAAVNGENGGTPGYSKDAVKGDKSNWMNQVTISEIMLGTEEGAGAARVPRATRLPQWFEIYNASMTEAVSINNWYLEIQNSRDEFTGVDYRGNLHATLRLPNVVVQPNQTVLVVSGSGLNSGNFPEQRTINLFTNGGYRNELGIRSRGEPVLNPAGFYIQLRDHKNNHVDEIGNLGLRHDVAGRTGVGRRDEDIDTWDIEPEDLISQDDGHRTSLIRIYDRGTPRDGLMPVGGPKDASTSWIRASSTNFRNVPGLTFYGNQNDYGTPGYRGGGPLPVSLSKFRPERLDSGEVVIRWVTESELNNAGFNILRTESRNGEYQQVNTELIAGHGTTSERHTYEWKDTTAKPNVVYYYQIQDVSFDGQVQTLRVSRLKGNVSAEGKATMTWGELKALQ